MIIGIRGTNTSNALVRGNKRKPLKSNFPFNRILLSSAFKDFLANQKPDIKIMIISNRS